MTIKTIDCVECGESVPYGRLSCPACGALLASVAGARRPTVRVSSTSAIATATAIDDAPEPMLTLTQAPPSADPEPTLAAEPGAPPAAEAAVAAEPEVAAEPMSAVEPAPAREPEPITAEPVIEPLLAEPDEAEGTLWPPLVEPAPTLAPRPYQSVEVERHVPYGTPSAQPSGYRPSTYSPTDGPDWSDATAAGSDAATTAAPSVDAAAAAGKTTRPLLIDPERFVEIATWFAIVGAAMAVLGFLLPWSRVVLGASGVGGYFDGWGLASPTHVFVVLGLLAVLAVEILRAPVPDWLRTGIPGLILGGLIVGLVWPYVVGRLGADIGVLVAGLGGLALIIGGVVASWATRHGQVQQAV